MRKKILTSLAVGALTAACALSFTACGGSLSVPKGEEVTADGWKTAIEATVKATNYTVEMSSTEKSVETYTEDGKTITYTEESNSSGTMNLADDTLYSKLTAIEKTTGANLVDEDEEDIDYTVTNERYAVVKESVLWSASIREYTYRQGTPNEEESKTPEWTAYSNDCSTAEAAKAALVSGAGVSYMFTSPAYTTEKDGTDYKSIADLYESFTYASGKYTATLYNYGGECTIEISVKGGYVVGYSVSGSEEESDDDASYKSEMKAVYVFKNYGKTSVSAPSGATEAINKAQAE